MPSASAPSEGCDDLLRLYVHVVPSAEYYCEHVRREHARMTLRAAGPELQGAAPRGNAVRRGPEAEEDGLGDAKPDLKGASVLNYDPSQHARLLLLYKGEVQTVKDLREDVLDRYKKAFGKIRKVGYIGYVFDQDLFALADEYRLRDCFRSGDHVVIVGTRARILRMRRSALPGGGGHPRRAVVKTENRDAAQPRMYPPALEEESDDGSEDEETDAQAPTELVEASSDEEIHHTWAGEATALNAPEGTHEAEEEPRGGRAHESIIRRSGDAYDAMKELDSFVAYAEQPDENSRPATSSRGLAAKPAQKRKPGGGKASAERMPLKKKPKAVVPAGVDGQALARRMSVEVAARSPMVLPPGPSPQAAKKPRKKFKAATELRAM